MDVNKYYYILQIHFGTCLARMYLAANVIGINCAAGMSELIKKDILEVCQRWLSLGHT